MTSSPPGALIRRDDAEGELLGRTPLELEVKPGRQALHLSLDGHHPRTLPIDALPGQTTLVEAALQPTRADVTMIVVPADTDWTLPGWISVGVSGALLLATGGVAWLTLDTIEEANTYSRAAPGHSRDELNSIQGPVDELALTSYITGGLSLLSLAAGLLMIALDEAPDEAAPPVTTVRSPTLDLSPAGLRLALPLP